METHLKRNKMKQTAVEWLIKKLETLNLIKEGNTENELFRQIELEAKEMEKQQLFLASNTSAKESYKAGQASMYCGCYEYEGATTYEEWLYEQFKNK